MLAALGTAVAALATHWSIAGIDFSLFMLVIGANPATVSYVLLNVSDHEREGQAERTMAIVFGSWPAAMIFAPALGGLIADRWGIRLDLWIGTLGFIVALAIFALAADVRPAQTEARAEVRTLFMNRRYVTLAVCYPLLMIALYVGFALAPNYLESVRGYSFGTIGFMFSVLSVGTLGFNYVVGKARPQESFVVLVGAAPVQTMPQEQIKALVQNTIAVKTGVPDKLDAWREAVRDFRKQALGFGDGADNELAFADALLAVLDDQPATLPDDNPYQPYLKQVIEAIAGYKP